jgi:hypothetical protein
MLRACSKQFNFRDISCCCGKPTNKGAGIQFLIKDACSRNTLGNSLVLSQPLICKISSDETL